MTTLHRIIPIIAFIQSLVRIHLLLNAAEQRHETKFWLMFVCRVTTPAGVGPEGVRRGEGAMTSAATAETFTVRRNQLTLTHTRALKQVSDGSTPTNGKFTSFLPSSRPNTTAHTACGSCAFPLLAHFWPRGLRGHQWWTRKWWNLDAHSAYWMDPTDLGDPLSQYVICFFSFEWSIGPTWWHK